MKREIDVTAYRTVTEFDKDNSLISTVELRVPAEELNYFQDVLRAVDAKKDVRCTLIVRDRDDQAQPRRLPLTLKSSKMKNFVPVAVFSKYGNTDDNLTELFSTGRFGLYVLLLVVEVVEQHQQEELDFDGEPVTPAWVLAELLLDEQAQERMVAEGCPNCAEAEPEGDPEYLRAAALVAASDYDDVCNLLAAIGIDWTDWDDPATTETEDLISMRQTLLAHWRQVAALQFREVA